MVSPDLDQDISPIPRSREENQERAFSAASRRKDRSLDARLESANRTSTLHRKRTGKAFHITKKINTQTEELFHRHLLAAFAARTKSTGSASSSSIASRRAKMTSHTSINGGSSRKMNLDLSNLQPPFPHGMEWGSSTSSITATAAATESYVLLYHPRPLSTRVPAYVTQTPIPAWNTQHIPPVWTRLQQQNSTSNQAFTDNQAVFMWQHQMMQQAQMPVGTATSIQMRQFRHCFSSAPELLFQHIVPPALADYISRSSSGYSHDHYRESSQPNSTYPNLHLSTQKTHLAQMVPFITNSPKVETLSADTQSTPDFCPTPDTPLSLTAVETAEAVATTMERDEVMVSHEKLDPDFNEFSQFALSLVAL
ncbi:hypothetical protein N7478_010530 [Penicillium angulare]|uniref:uncharacterized protein n=1 Tax=Penicillium angulare TaxID=116970 RepID=UPI0025423719|nr:uncharacterized protein N7478_010530 [Penicillium angulare]KAJ5267722.1 hypothetical protein N7478_010530 [Penicillium angulare]